MKKKKIFRSAEAARAARDLSADWEKLQKKWEPKTPIKAVKQHLLVDPVNVRGTSNVNVKSLGSWVTGVASSRPPMQYTGTKMLGIGTLHKSNAVPVFDDAQAVAIASMRR